MSKNTSKYQMQHLLTLMEVNPDIACGFFKGSKDALSRFWRDAETELNSLGPPTKCVSEWKKVWADQKKYVRQKAAKNSKEQKGTGGGPSMELKFSAIEEGIYNLLAMKTSVEGVPVEPIGLNSAKNKTPSPTMEQALIDEVLVVPEEPDEPPNIAPEPMQRKKANPPDGKNKIIENPIKALQAELDVQKDVLGAIKSIALNQKDLEQGTKRIYRALEKANKLRQKHYTTMENLEREKLEELRHHNSFMEKMRVKEIEYKLEKTRMELEVE